MSIFLGNSEPSKIFVGGSEVASVWAGGTKVRPNRLPSAYQEVEYIQSSGTQYINTGYIPNNNTKVECSISNWSNAGSHNDVFGARQSWSSSGRGFIVGYEPSYSQYYCMFGGIYQGGAQGVGFSLLFADGNKHNIEMSQSGIYIDGTLKVNFTTVTFTSPVNMYIFGMNNNGSISERAGYRLYSFKIYDNGTLTRDFIPCYRKSDSVIGLYDKVGGIFYTNAGSGTFTKGSNV